MILEDITKRIYTDIKLLFRPIINLLTRNQLKEKTQQPQKEVLFSSVETKVALTKGPDITENLANNNNGQSRLETFNNQFPFQTEQNSVQERQCFNCAVQLLEKLTLSEILEKYAQKTREVLLDQSSMTEPQSLDRDKIYRITGIKLNAQNQIIKIRYDSMFLVEEYQKRQILNDIKDPIQISFYVSEETRKVFSKLAHAKQLSDPSVVQNSKVKIAATVDDNLKDVGSSLQKVAIKKVPKIISHTSMLEKIKQEIRMLELTDQFKGFIETNRFFYIISDLQFGKTIKLKDYQQKTLEEKLDIATSIVNDLTMLHEKEIFHYDLKGENIMVDGTTAKIIDFGSSIYKPQQADLEGIPIEGTGGYMAPEIGTHVYDFPDGKLEELDLKDNKTHEKIDVYSLGQTFIKNMDLINLGIVNKMVELEPQNRASLNEVKEAIEKYKKELPKIIELERKIIESSSLQEKMQFMQDLLQNHDVYSSSYQKLLEQAINENNSSVLQELIELPIFKNLALNIFYNYSGWKGTLNMTNHKQQNESENDIIKELLNCCNSNEALKQIILDKTESLIQNYATSFAIDQNMLLKMYQGVELDLGSDFDDNNVHSSLKPGGK